MVQSKIQAAGMCGESSGRKRPGGHTVRPSSEEQKIFTLLLDVVEFAQSKTVVRVAGAWSVLLELGK